MFDTAAIEDWVRKAAALYAGVPLDYASMHMGPKMGVEYAHVKFGDRPIEESVAEVMSHVRDIGESAADDGETSAGFRVKLFRSKQPCGSKIFRTATAPGELPHTGPGERYTAEDLRSEYVITVRELRQLSTGVVSALAEQGQAGWKFASQLAGQNQALIMQNAKLQAEVEVLKRSQAPAQDDPLMKSAGAMLEQLPTIFLTMQQLAAEKKEAANKAED